MRRLAFALVALPFVCVAYACSDDPEETPSGDDAGNGADTSSPNEDSGGDKPDGSSNLDANTDSGDGGATETCVGNPLSADGGAGDGGPVTVQLTQIAQGSFLDGPHYVDDFGGVFIYSEVFNQVVRRVQPDGGSNTAVRGTNNNNVLVIGNGNIGTTLFTAQTGNAQGAILRSNIADGGDAGTLGIGTATSPNDLVISKKGFVYFTDPGYQGGAAYGVYHLLPADGGVTAIGTPGVNARPDGIALSPKEDFLYVSNSDTRTVVKHAVDANGNVSATSAPVFTATERPVGIAVDSGGNLWVAESAIDDNTVSGRVEVVDPAGKKWGEILFPTARVTNVAFGGPDNKTVAITTEQGATVSGMHVFKTRCSGIR